MPELLIRCPVTKKMLSTGVSLREEVFAKADLEKGSVLCPHCGATHSWSKKDAFLWR